MNKISNIANKIFVFSSGYDEEVLKYCPQFEVKQTYSLGAINFLSSVISTIAYVFAFQMIVQNTSISVLLGICLGFMGFYVNRIASIRQTTYFKGRILMTLFLPILFSFLTAILLWYPVLIIIFKGEMVQSNNLFENINNMQSLISRNSNIEFMAYVIFFLLLMLDLLPFIAQFIITPNMNAYNKVMKLKLERSINMAYRSMENDENKNKMTILDTIKSDIYKNDLRSAINQLNLVIDANLLVDEKNELVLLLSKIRQLRNEMAHNTIDNEFGSRELNYLKMNLLSLLERLNSINNLNIPKTDKNILTNN